MTLPPLDQGLVREGCGRRKDRLWAVSEDGRDRHTFGPRVLHRLSDTPTTSIALSERISRKSDSETAYASRPKLGRPLSPNLPLRRRGPRSKRSIIDNQSRTPRPHASREPVLGEAEGTLHENNYPEGRCSRVSRSPGRYNESVHLGSKGFVRRIGDAERPLAQKLEVLGEHVKWVGGAPDCGCTAR